MRLTNAQQRHILSAARRWFGPEAVVRLFGSRVDDAARGGDIDLFIELDRSLPDKIEKTVRFEAELVRGLGDRKIDVLVRDAATSEQPIHRLARETGIVLSGGDPG